MVYCSCLLNRSNESHVRKTLVVAISLVLIFPAVSRLFVQHAHFVNSANAKAKILLQTVEQAPRYESNARVILLTDMSLKVLSEHGIDSIVDAYVRQRDIPSLWRLPSDGGGTVYQRRGLQHE